MNFFAQIVHSLLKRPKKDRLDLATYHILGLGISIQINDINNDEKKLIIDGINKFVAEIEHEFNNLIEKDLYGNLTKDQASEVLMKHSTVQEGMEQIPGRVPLKAIEQKKIFIIPLLEQLRALKKYGEENKIYQSDFVELKRLLLTSLFRQIGTHEDIPNFEFVIDELKKLDMIPVNISFVEMTRYCALGRWY